MSLILDPPEGSGVARHDGQRLWLDQAAFGRSCRSGHFRISGTAVSQGTAQPSTVPPGDVLHDGATDSGPGRARPGCRPARAQRVDPGYLPVTYTRTPHLSLPDIAPIVGRVG